jgi:tetratricopeptide (TPR) repeat protein
MSLCRRSSALLLLFAMFVANLPYAPAFAKGTKEGDEARRERLEGTVALNLGHYDDAAEHFESAYALTQDPLLLFYLGQAYRLGGKPEKALAAYNSFLRSSSPSSKNREQYERAAADIELIATVLVKRGAPAQTQGNLAEKVIPPAAKLSPPASQNPAEESLEPPALAEKTTKTTTEKSQQAPALAPSLASERAARDLVLVQAQPVPPPPEESKPRFYKKWWFWTGVAGALALGGATVWWYTRSTPSVPGTTYGSQRVLP